MSESLFQYNNLSDFEKNLFLTKQVKELKQLVELQKIKIKEQEDTLLSFYDKDANFKELQSLRQSNGHLRSNLTKLKKRLETNLSITDNVIKIGEPLKRSSSRKRKALGIFDDVSPDDAIKLTLYFYNSNKTKLIDKAKVIRIVRAGETLTDIEVDKYFGTAGELFKIKKNLMGQGKLQPIIPDEDLRKRINLMLKSLKVTNVDRMIVKDISDNSYTIVPALAKFTYTKL